MKPPGRISPKIGKRKASFGSWACKEGCQIGSPRAGNVRRAAEWSKKNRQSELKRQERKNLEIRELKKRTFTTWENHPGEIPKRDRGGDKRTPYTLEKRNGVWRSGSPRMSIVGDVSEKVL